MSQHEITVTINGDKQTRSVEARTLLVHFIRETLGLTGTHIGCDTTSCGACTVSLDGEAVKSCTVFAVQADGATIETVEGLAAGGALHPLQEGFWEKHGLQCGFCTPGMLMSARALLRAQPAPERGRDPPRDLREPVPLHRLQQDRRSHPVRRRQARRRRKGSLSHADATRRPHRAPLAQARRRSANVPTTDDVRVTTPAKVCGMGHRMKRKEDPRFIQGKGRYVDDVKLPNMVYMDIVRSPYAHAKILKIDTSAALATPGVLAVITGEDLKKAGNLHWMPTLMSDTQMVLPIEKVVYYAQEVCAVIATERYIAADAVEKVEVEYEPLEAVVDPHVALDDKVIVRDDKPKKTNHIWHWEAGDKAATDAVFAGAATVVEEKIYLPRIHVSSIETCGMVANYDKARSHMQIYMTSQAPHAHRTVFALVSRAARAHDPDHLARHRRRVRRQGPGLPGLRVLRGRQPRARPAGQVDRGPQREPPGRQLRARLPHHGAARGRQGRQDHRPPGPHAVGLRRGRRRGQPVEVPGRPVQHLHRLVRHEGRAHRGRRRLHQQAAGRRRLPLLVPGHRGRPHDRADGRHPRPPARRGPRRLPAQELHPPRSVPLQVADRLGVRQRQLQGRARQGDGR